MSDPRVEVNRRDFMKASAATGGAVLGGGVAGSDASRRSCPAPTTPGFPYLLEERGPLGVSISSWLNPSGLALVLNDFQNLCILPEFGLTTEYSRSRYANSVRPNTQQLLSRFRELGLPVVYTILATRHPSFLDLPGVCRKVLARGLKMSDGTPYHLRVDEKGAQVSRELAPRSKEICIVKTSSGAFDSSDIDNVLRNNGISSLVFTGGVSEFCLNSTVRGAYDRGYLCTVAEDATLTGSAERQHWAMEFLRTDYAWVTGTATMLGHLR